MVYNMMGYGWGMGWGIGMLLGWLIGIGLVLLVWLWVIKLWREVAAKKRR